VAQRPRAGHPEGAHDDLRTPGRAHVYDSSPPDNHLDARAVRGRAHRLWAGTFGLFGNSADKYLKVHHRGPAEADVTEGSNGIWERLHYDWSDPGRVVMTTTDSNLWEGASGHTYTFTRRPNGTTDLDAVVVRDGKNLKGKLLGFVLRFFGERVLGRELEKTVKAIEARNYNSARSDSDPR